MSLTADHVVDDFLAALTPLAARLVRTAPQFPALQGLVDGWPARCVALIARDRHRAAAAPNPSAYARAARAVLDVAEHLVSHCTTTGGFALAVDWVASAPHNVLDLLAEGRDGPL